MLLFNMDTILEHYIIHQYFNTSNVTIQPPDYISEKIMKENFNTSNVTIQQLSFVCWYKSDNDFNTSNVTIQQFKANITCNPNWISIHLMLLFNPYMHFPSCI